MKEVSERDGTGCRAGPSGPERTDVPQELQCAARQFAAGMAHGSTIVETPGYHVHFWPQPHPFYRSIAIPRNGDAGAPAAIVDMTGTFTARQGTPRLEFFAEMYPGLETALHTRGFRTEMRAPVLVCSSPPPGAERGERLCGDIDPAGFMTAGENVFACGEPPSPDEVATMRALLASRRCMALAVCDGNGSYTGGASLCGIADGMAEMAAVWTAPGARRLGTASGAIRRLLRLFFDDGGRMVWLSAATPESHALYHRLDFRRIGTQVNLFLPA